MIWRVFSLEYTNIPDAFFTHVFPRMWSRFVVASCIILALCHCSVVGHSCTNVPKSSFVSVFQQWPSIALPVCDQKCHWYAAVGSISGSCLIHCCPEWVQFTPISGIHSCTISGLVGFHCCRTVLSKSGVEPCGRRVDVRNGQPVRSPSLTQGLQAHLIT
jgi:hypothetical protein